MVEQCHEIHKIRPLMKLQLTRQMIIFIELPLPIVTIEGIFLESHSVY